MLSFWKKERDGGEESGSKARFLLIILGALVGVALLLFGGRAETKENDAPKEVYSPAEDEIVLYQSYLEERVRALCQSVAGVDRVTAIVTLSGGFESVYAVEQKDGNEEYVLVGSGSSASALFLSRSAPEIAGIGVVCHASDAATKNELIALISSAFHVPINRIHVSFYE